MDTQNAAEEKDTTLIGIAHGIAAFFTLAVMAVFVKLLGEKFSVIEIAFYRNIIPLSCIVLYALTFKKLELFHTHKPKAVFMRVIIGTAALLLTFGAMDALPLANATVLFFTSTLIVPILSFIFLDDKIGKHRIIAACVGFLGVLIIAQPGNTGFAGIGVALALGAAVGHAIIQIFLRYLRAENPITLSLYFMLGGTVIPGLLLPFYAIGPGIEDIPYLLGVGISGGLAQYFLSCAFRNAPATVVSPFNYTGLIWASGFDILIWHIVPGWPVFAGGAVIIASSAYIMHREHSKKPSKHTKADIA